MSYLLNSLGNLPVDDGIDFYIFVVNGQWKEPLYEMMEQNFKHIGRSIGDKAVLAMGLNPEEWRSELEKKYLGKDSGRFSGLLPLLIITDRHPEDLTDDSMRLIIPLQNVEKRFGGWPEFFRLMSEYVRLENDDFLKNFQDSGTLDAANRIVSIKPGMFGISINVNELVSIWNNRRKEAKAPAKAKHI
jgi:hypothetical protein